MKAYVDEKQPSLNDVMALFKEMMSNLADHHNKLTMERAEHHNELMKLFKEPITKSSEQADNCEEEQEETSDELIKNIEPKKF